MRMVRKVSAKPVTVESSSDTDSVQPVSGPGPNTLAHRAATLATNVERPAVGVLKRKREATESRASPPGARPVVLIRKVVSAPIASKPTPRTTRASPSPAKKASPAKTKTVAPSASQARIKMRKVVDTRKPKVPSTATFKGKEPGESLEVSPTAASSSGVIEIMSSPIAGSNEASSSSIPIVSAAGAATVEATVAPPDSAAEDGVSQLEAQSTPEPDPGSETTSLRRTTRSRRSTQSDSDVFGPVAPASSRTGQQRRKIILVPDNSAFSGMSALALKSLTATNTQRNQKQFCEMQTEVILKNGKRPDSPTTKVRNVLDKQREEEKQQRQERAERRARKMAGEEGGDVSMLSADEDPADSVVSHRRGPGDEEDYETPERTERPSKRGRFEEDETADEETRQQKRVKWDRGLATTVFLSDTPPKPRRPPKEELTKKGCLANAAKVRNST